MHFSAQLEIIDINPFVFVPEKILEDIFNQAQKRKGAIPIMGTVNGKPFTQTLVKFRKHWRLYINMTMLKNSPKRIGETIDISVEYDPRERTIEPHPKLTAALNNNETAKQVFDNLSPSRQKEIIRYISNLKTEESVERNVLKTIHFLLGDERFVGRDKP
jgi:Bacteriocin-protection, YdeI or OmpD-Associated/Domain of unknown function (DUF1905)